MISADRHRYPNSLHPNPPSSVPLPFPFSHFPEVLERIKPGRVAVAPNRLDRVATDIGDAPEFKSPRRQWLIRMAVNVTHNVTLAFAPGAGTTSAQRFQPHKTFGPILPLDCKFLPNLLNVRRPHAPNLFDSRT